MLQYFPLRVGGEEKLAVWKAGYGEDEEKHGGIIRRGECQFDVCGLSLECGAPRHS